MRTKNFPGKKQRRRTKALNGMSNQLNKLKTRLHGTENKDKKHVIQLRIETLEICIYNTNSNSVDDPRDKRTKKGRTK